MAIRQYVGARYVPRFTGLYDATQIYDALDVVDNGAGTSYIAKKTVPAGTSLTDTDYWFVYGASSGAIISLQGRMDAAENNISDLDNRIDRRFVLIGDSYAIGVGTPPDEDGWAYQFKSLLGLDDYHCYLSIEGGSGFIGNVALRFVDKLESAALAVQDIDTITDIVVCGGFNDLGKSGVGDAVEAFCNRAAALFPNALVSIGFVGYSTATSGTLRADIRHMLREYYVGRTGRCRILNNVEYALRTHTGLMGTDGIHPTALGYLALTKCIISAVFDGDGYDYYNDYTAAEYTDISGITKTCVQLVEREWTSIRFSPDLAAITVGATKPTATNWFKIADFGANNLAHGVATALNQLNYYFAEANVMCHFTGSGYKDIRALLGIMEDSLYIKLTGVDPSTGAWYDYTNLNTISLEGLYYFKTLDL